MGASAKLNICSLSDILIDLNKISDITIAITYFL